MKWEEIHRGQSGRNRHVIELPPVSVQHNLWDEAKNTQNGAIGYRAACRKHAGTGCNQSTIQGERQAGLSAPGHAKILGAASQMGRNQRARCARVLLLHMLSEPPVLVLRVGSHACCLGRPAKERGKGQLPHPPLLPPPASHQRSRELGCVVPVLRAVHRLGQVNLGGVCRGSNSWRGLSESSWVA